MCEIDCDYECDKVQGAAFAKTHSYPITTLCNEIRPKVHALDAAQAAYSLAEVT